MKQFIYIAMLCLSCASGVEIPAPVVVQEFTGVAEPEREWFPNWVIDDGLMPSVSQAVTRWSNASCLDIQIVPQQGTLWFYVDEIPKDEESGLDPLGMTGPDTFNPLWVELIQSDVEDYVALHEMGHRLGLDHAENEIMTDRFTPSEFYIGENTLIKLCTMRNCGCFNPESAELTE